MLFPFVHFLHMLQIGSNRGSSTWSDTVKLDHTVAFHQLWLLIRAYRTWDIHRSFESSPIHGQSVDSRFGPIRSRLGHRGTPLFNLDENLRDFRDIFEVLNFWDISLIFGGWANWGQVSIKVSILLHPSVQVSGWPLVRFLTLSKISFIQILIFSKIFWNFREFEFNRKEVSRVHHLVIKKRLLNISNNVTGQVSPILGL